MQQGSEEVATCPEKAKQKLTLYNQQHKLDSKANKFMHT